MSVPMARVEVIGLKSDLSTAVSTLQALGSLQIEAITDCPEAAVPPLALPEPDGEQERHLEALSARLERLHEALGRYERATAAVACASLDDACAGCSALAPQVESLLDRCREIGDELSRLEALRPALTALGHVAPALPAGAVASYYTVSSSRLGSIDSLASSLAPAGSGIDVAWASGPDGSVAVVISCPPALTDRARSAATEAGLVPVSVPEAAACAAPAAVLQSLEVAIAAAVAEREEAKERLAEFARRWSAEVAAWRVVVADQLECLRVRRRFGETATAFVLVGWAPESEVPALATALERALHGAVSVRRLRLSAADRHRAPVALHNPLPARPFESLVRLVSLPSYGATDPTVLMAILLPVFSGMMLGDIGYGLLLLALSLWLRTRVAGSAMRDLLSVLAVGAAWAIGFGFLYGELFGGLGAHLGLRPLWGERTDSEHMTALLGVAVAIGVAHISLGLVLGIREAVRWRSRAHLLERTGMLVGLIGLLAVMGVAAGLVPRPFLPLAVGGIVLGIGLIAASIGWLGLFLGPIEFVGLIGNVLSYLRIAAIGLASALLAEVANDVAGLLGNLVAGVFIGLLIHLMNLVLGAFSPMIHSLRLHYVEFFRKFYQGGGSPYRPFRAAFSSPHTTGITGGTHGR